MVRLALSHGQFVIRAARNQTEATAILPMWTPHLALIDMDMDEGDLLSQLTTMRGGERIAIIALTRRGDLKRKLAAFERGADDILAVPFSPEELIARCLAIIRRSFRQAVPFTPVIKLRDLDIDILHRVVRAGASELHLTSLEQSLLYLLAAQAGQLVTREEILDTLWGTDYIAESNVVDRHVRNLRAKLKDDWRRPRFIATVPGHGYCFVSPLTATHD
jgi:DNA-binding response OmpR family regulator